MRLPFHTLDVFTQTRFGGNPLAVVLEADALPAEAMQQIAREFALSETVFVLAPQNPAHTARLRIFTPNSELPFAGHPTVGTAALLAQLRNAPGQASGEAIVVLEEGIGPVRAGVRLTHGEPAFAEFDAPKMPVLVPDLGAFEKLSVALGLLPTEIGFENHKPARFSAGLSYACVPVRDLDTLARVKITARHWADAFGPMGAAYVYCRETAHKSAHFRARMFDPGHGISEDPATGSAAAAFAGMIAHFDGLTDGAHKRRIEQGYEMGRPSDISIEIAIANRAIVSVRIGGHAVRVMDGMLEI